MTVSKMRASASIIELADDLMAVLAPITGTRATGSVIVKPVGKEPVYLQRNWPLVPIVNGAARDDLKFKIGQGPNRAKYPNGIRKKESDDEPDTESWWTIQPGGTLVDIHSIVGGARHNLKRGTKFVFEPYNENVEVEVVLQSTMTDGADPIHFGGCMSVAQFEQMNGPLATLDAFRAELGKLPAIVFVWGGSEPADGTTTSSLSRADTRTGVKAQLFKEAFDVFVISERLDSGKKRRTEGLKLLDDATFWLTDRQEVDGQVFSAPTGVQVRSRSRVATNNSNYQSVYIYLLQISVTHTWDAYDQRTWNPWLLAHNEILTHDEDDDGNQKVVVNQDMDMTTDEDDTESSSE